MKKVFVVSLLIFLFTTLSFSNLDLGVNLSSSIYVGLDKGDVKYNVISSKFTFTSSLSDYVRVYSSILDRFQFSRNGGINSFELYEGYVKVEEFLYKDLEFSFGKQRISWGRADKINPTDVLNPFDLSEMIDFSTKYPSWALDLKLYIPVLEDTFLQLVLEPTSMPARLNSTIVSAYENKIKDKVLSEVMPESIGNISGFYQPIDLNITNGIVGIKFSTKVFDTSASLSFVSRDDDIPYVSKIYTTNGVNVSVVSVSPLILKTNITVSNITYYMDYYRESMIGFDISKDVGICLLWFEMGVFLPQEVNTEISSFSLVITPSSTNAISTNWVENYLKDGYTRYVLGFDKTFDDDLYLNFQFAHGLGIERGGSEEKLQDYFIFNIEKKFFENTFKVRLYSILNFDGIFDRFRENNLTDALTKNTGILGGVEFSYYPVIGMKIYFSLIGIDANGTSRLYDFRDFDMINIGFGMEL